MLFLKKKIEAVLVFLAIVGMAEPCFAQEDDRYVIENGRITVFDSQSFSIGDEGEAVLERLGDYDSTDEYPGGEWYNYFEKGLSVSIDFDGNIDLVSLFCAYNNPDGGPRIETPLGEVVVEGMGVDRQTSMAEFISTLQEGDYAFEIDEYSNRTNIIVDFENGYKCALRFLESEFLESKDYFFDEIQYYASK